MSTLTILYIVAGDIVGMTATAYVFGCRGHNLVMDNCPVRYCDSFLCIAGTVFWPISFIVALLYCTAVVPVQFAVIHGRKRFLRPKVVHHRTHKLSLEGGKNAASECR